MAPPMRRPGNERRESGAALVEFAFVLPVLLLLVLGIIDFSRAYNAKQELTHATREGVRVYAVTNSKALATATFMSAVTGLDPNEVHPEIPNDNSCVAGNSVEVRASYSFDFIVLPFVSINIGSQAVMRCGG